MTNQTCSTKTQQNTNIRQTYKYQTTNQSFIRNTIRKKETQNTNSQTWRTSNCAKWNFKQYDGKQNDTSDLCIVCEIYKHQIRQEENSDKQTLFNGKTTHDRNYGKWQTTNNHFIWNNIQTNTKTKKRDPTYKQSKTTSKSLCKMEIQTILQKGTYKNGMALVCKMKIQTSY